MSHALAPSGGHRAWRGDDFPAWLSPMLVKELRQGVQSGVFGWTCIALHAAAERHTGARPAGDVAVFAALRQWKDGFRA